MTEKTDKSMGGPSTPGDPETVPLEECSRAPSNDHLSLRTESTIFSLARTESQGTPTLPRRAWRSHRPAIILMSTGGSMLLAGFVLCGLYFAEEYSKLSANDTSAKLISTRTNQTMYSLICGTIMGPPLLSIGLMVMMVGVVLIPVTREMRQQSMKRLYSFKPQQLSM
ncbi:phosphoinositide-interacting protein-like [Sardina pilchardus]|uniref:phosphoinositide-interacting protein-like n=1 Tax=Sardina pilchardus TaxID=27697 RepID=UPI002E153A91